MVVSVKHCTAHPNCQGGVTCNLNTHLKSAVAGLASIDRATLANTIHCEDIMASQLNLETYRAMWKMMLDKPFNPTELKKIKDDYDIAVKMDKTYRALYEQQRQVYLKEFYEVQEVLAAELRPLSKPELAKKLGYSSAFDLRRATKDDMIRSYVWSKANEQVKSDHQRVQEIWAAMSDAEKIGEA